jgi:hypothetical protein
MFQQGAMDDMPLAGIVGSDFLSKNCIEIGPQQTRFCDREHPCTHGLSIPTHDTDNGQHGVKVVFKHGSKTHTETCFLDTGGKVAMMSEKLWGRLGQDSVRLPSDQEQQIAHTDANGNMRSDTMLTRQNYEGGDAVGMGLVASDGSVLDAAPPTLHRVPDGFNTLYGFECSIGTEHLQHAAGRSIRLNLHRNEVCLAP